MLKHLLFSVLIIAGGYYYWTTRPITHGPGEMAPNKPKQEKAFGVKDIQHKNYTVSPLAKFEMQARVLAKKAYYADKQSDILPYDVVFGWGPMSDERNLDHILIKQSNRDYKWEMTRPPIPEKQMKLYSANMHLIPANLMIKEKLGELREGHIVKIKGLLVKVSSDKGWEIKSSLSRIDSGSKANEVVWIESLEIL
ncbi:MAG: hypothetical protein U5J95_01625 [Balneolaceae bacterium]|nr:hypothetical protein [Balneolaceae bacterium]